MTCHEVRESLSAYLDEALTPDERARVDAHLETCADCPRELASLRATVTLLRRVQPVRAPVGFVDRTLALTRPRPWYRRLAEALLLPLSVKVPVQVTGVALIALLAVYLFERTPELKQAARFDARPDAPAEDRPAPALRPPIGAASTPPAQRAKPVVPAPTAPPAAEPGASQIASRGESDRPDTSGRRDAAPQSPAARVQPPPAAAPAPAREVGAFVAPTGAPPPVKKEALGAAQAEAERRQAGLERSQDAARSAPSSPAPRAAATPRVLGPADVIARVAVQDRDAAERELAALIARVGGTVVQRRSEEALTVVEAVIPQPRYAEFSEAVGRIGSWQVEAERPDLPALIRVVLRLQ